MNSKEIKDLIRNVIEEESKKDGVDVDLHVYTIHEYRKSDIYKERLKLDKGQFLKAFNPPNRYDLVRDEICIFIDRYSNVINYIDLPLFRNKNQLYHILRSSYHEYRHKLQNQKYKDGDLNQLAINMGNEFSYDDFITFLDNVNKDIVYKGCREYSKFHDFYYFEMDAEKYSLNKTKEWLKNNNLYSKYEDTFDIDRLYNDTCNTLYDIQLSFSKFMLLLRTKDINSIPYENTFFEIFFIKNYKENCFKFKQASEILSNPKFQKLDYRIKCTILSNYNFMGNLNYDNLNPEESEYINSALLYTYRLEQARKEKMIEFNNSISKIKHNPKYNLIYSDLRFKDRIERMKKYQKNKKGILGDYYKILENSFNDIYTKEKEDYHK